MKKVEDVVTKGFKSRLQSAHKQLEFREGGPDITREEIAFRLARVLGRKVKPGTVATYFSGSIAPPKVGIGLAEVYGVKAGWLYFNEGIPPWDARRLERFGVPVVEPGGEPPKPRS